MVKAAKNRKIKMKTALGCYLDARSRLGEDHRVTRDWRASVPHWQWLTADFGEFAAGCHDRREVGVPRRPGNALNVEMGAPAPRCMQKSPDGRGLTWLMSGGSVLAYGCCANPCPRFAKPK